MKYNGIQFKRAKHLGFRMGNPDKDLTLYGDPIEPNYVVIVSIKDCKIEDRGDTKVYIADNAPPAFPHGYSETLMAYGPRRMHKNPCGRITKITVPVYIVHNAIVYQGTVTYRLNPVCPDNFHVGMYEVDKKHARKWRAYMKGGVYE